MKLYSQHVTFHYILVENLSCVTVLVTTGTFLYMKDYKGNPLFECEKKYIWNVLLHIVLNDYLIFSLIQNIEQKILQALRRI